MFSHPRIGLLIVQVNVRLVRRRLERRIWISRRFNGAISVRFDVFVVSDVGWRHILLLRRCSHRQRRRRRVAALRSSTFLKSDPSKGVWRRVVMMMHMISVSCQWSELFTCRLDARFLDHRPVGVAVVPWSHATPWQCWSVVHRCLKYQSYL